MMPGGDKQAYNAVKPILEAVSAKVNGDPCVTYIGPGASGHFVKMVHNGIEYAMMQVLAETYALLKHSLGYSNEQIYATFDKWNNGRLKSFLLEVTKDIFKVKDPKTGNLLLDMIKDEAKSKGTGKWTSQVSMDLQLPIPTINEAVSTRDLSKFKSLRIALSKALPHQGEAIDHKEAFEVQLEQALYFAMITSYAQGLHLLEAASAEYKYELNLKEISQIWRGGCIIRAELLEDIYQAYKKNPELPHLFSDESIQQKLKDIIPGTRHVVITAIAHGIAIPCYASALTYYDSLRTANSPLNLTQAQRDFFGAHTFERIDEEGIFHADWNSTN
jgi:6-phosphogluconate dehydrogenase